ncbi:MAG: type II secretion system protein GspD [Simkaniaceae bacterium]
MNNSISVNLIICLFSLVAYSWPAYGSQTIEEKELKLQGRLEAKENFSDSLTAHNQKLRLKKQTLQEKYEQAALLCKNEASEEAFQSVLSEVNQIRQEIHSLQEDWKKKSLESQRDDEPYAFWDQEETTLSDLIMEYGSGDYLYIIPPQLANMKMHMHSLVAIPRESWSELLEIILSQNGIGIKNLNPYARQLYILKHELMAVEVITGSKEHLDIYSDATRMAFIFSPGLEQLKTVTYFFERFRDPKKTFIYQVGTKIVIVSNKDEVQKLLTLYDAVWEKENEKQSRVFSLKKISAIEMEKILKAFFCDDGSQSRLALIKGGESLSIFSLKEENILILVGSKKLIEKSEEVIRDTEQQIHDPTEMTVFWYTCKHSDPIDVAEILEKVYVSLVSARFEECSPEGPICPPDKAAEVNIIDSKQKACPYPYGPPPLPPYASTPTAVPGTIKSQTQKSHTLNFIPYPKSGSLMMVVRKDTLDKIKELLKRIDVPKRMVEIEVLLFEKKINNQENFGINMLKIGSPADNVHRTGATFNDPNVSKSQGIFQFFIQRPKYKNWPAFDIFYNFLMSQDNVQINASPSVTTINQTPATISIVDEISINNGAAPIETSSGTIAFEKSFSRAQYGITLVLTPTIHEPNIFDEDADHFITLETNVQFDTTKSDLNDRPNVNRRHIENTVRVANGETVILGGLRRKTSEDKSERIPFLGELPGFGKLFGFTRMNDQSTEMFIFITPRIIFDPKENMIKIRNQELCKRPGDLPEFLERIEDSKSRKKKKMFEQSFKLIFDANNG